MSYGNSPTCRMTCAVESRQQREYNTYSVQVYIAGGRLPCLAAKHDPAKMAVLYHDLFWRTLRLVPLAGLFKSIHIMTVVAALKLNHVKMYCR